MPTLSIKDVPESLAQRLRERAARNHRSLQGELMALIAAVAHDGASSIASVPADPTRFVPAAATLPAPATPFVREALSNSQRPRRTLEQIAAEHRVRFPHPIPGDALAVDLVRAERDRR